MTPLLKKAFEEAESLRDVDQDFIGWFVLEELEQGRLREESNDHPQPVTGKTDDRNRAPSLSNAATGGSGRP